MCLRSQNISVFQNVSKNGPFNTPQTRSSIGIEKFFQKGTKGDGYTCYNAIVERTAGQLVGHGDGKPHKREHDQSTAPLL